MGTLQLMDSGSARTKPITLRIVCVLAFAFMLSGLLSVALPAFNGAEKAYGDALAAGSTGSTLSTTETSNYKVSPITALERKAYNRALKACMDYENQPNPIVIDMSDLNLTDEQALKVGYMLHANGELFFVNTYNDSSYGAQAFSLPCYYDDATITKMRKRLDKAVEKALKRLGPAMTSATKVHMLHDYLIDTVTYTDQKKDAYTGLVERKADCFGYALSMDLLLQRAGYKTDMAFDSGDDHAWNLVKIGKYWYHVDVTFDRRFSNYKISSGFNWLGKHCHLYLLQSDASLSNDIIDWSSGAKIYAPKGWTCHYECKSTLYDADEISGSEGSFESDCDAYQKIVRAFKKDGIKYTVIGANKVSVTAVKGENELAAKALIIPPRVRYNKVTYEVCGINAKAFKNAQAKMLIIKTGSLKASSVKNSLKGSKVKSIKLKKAARYRVKAYKKYFEKSNSGKRVTVTSA